MPLRDYLVGLAFFAGTWGAAAYVAATVERRILPRLEPAVRALALGLLFLSVLVAAHVIPGMLGLLDREWVMLTALAGAALASRLPQSQRARERSATPTAPPAGRLGTAMAALAVLAVSAVLLAALSEVRGQPPEAVDAMSFALPGVAQWVRSGSIWDVGAFLGLIQVRTYPNNGDVLALAAILPWRNDAFLWLLPLPLLGMTGLGVYAAGRELRAPAATAAILGAAVVAARTVAEPTLYGLKPDAFMYATFAAGLLFLLRHARTRARSDLVLAGLGLGLAFGSRWYGLPIVTVVVAVWAAGLLVARRPVAWVLREGLVVVAVVLAAGGFWLLRNLALTGNPLYPVKVELLGTTIFHAPRDILNEKAGFSVIGRLGQPGFLRHELVPAFRAAFGLPGLIVLLGSLLASGLALRHARRRVSARPLAIMVAAAGVALVYAFLPAGAQGLAAGPVPGIVEANTRWLVPALLLAASASAWAIGRLGRARPAVDLLALVCVLVSLAAVFEVGNARVALAAAVLLLVWVLARRLPMAPRMLLRGRGPLAGGAAAACVALLAAAGYAHEKGYNEHRFQGRSAVVDWVQAHSPSGARIGLAGHPTPGAFVPNYALFGPRLRNQVAYVGPVVSDQVRFYHDPARFRRAVRRYDLVAVGRLEAPDFEHPRRQRILAQPRDARWARSAGFVEVARDDSYILLARPGSTATGSGLR
jgi:hypothetical protein